MKRQIETVRLFVALLLAAIALAIVALTPFGAGGAQADLPTQTVPPVDWQPTPTRLWILTPTPGPYPPPPQPTATYEPYPADAPRVPWQFGVYLPVVGVHP